MKVHQLMTKKAATISRDNNVVEAAKIMRETGCGSIIVVEGESPVGILTETDLLKKVVADGRNLYETSVGEVMTENPIVQHPNDNIAETSRRMGLAKIRRMPVVEDGKLKGIISTTDLRRYMKELERDLMDLTQILLPDSFLSIHVYLHLEQYHPDRYQDRLHQALLGLNHNQGH